MFSRFTAKIILLTVVPITLFYIFIVLIEFGEMDRLLASTADITEMGLQDIYRTHLKERSHDLAGKVSLKLDAIINELNIVTGFTQKLIDDDNLRDMGKLVQSYEPLRNDFEYNKAQNWSNLVKKDVDISMSVWGYLHDDNGNINQDSIDFTTRMAAIKPLLYAVGHYGEKKGWLYVTGPKKTPVMVMTPWAQMPDFFDELYPGHNTQNWWDFFFPGIVEAWDGWVQNPESKPDSAMGDITLTPLYEDAGGTGLMVTFFSPLWNKERTRSEGAASIDYNLSNLIDLVKDEKVGENGFSFLMQSDGNILGLEESKRKLLGLEHHEHDDDSGVAKVYTRLGQSLLPELKDTVARMQKKDFLIQEFVDASGIEYLLSFKNISSFKHWTGNGPEITADSLYLGMVVPKKEVLQIYDEMKTEMAQQSQQARNYLISVSVVLFLLSILIASIYAIRQTRQIRMMAQGAASIREKKFNVTVPIVSKDELGELAQTFNDMIQEVQKSYSQLQSYAVSLEEKVKERTVSLEQANAELQRLTHIDDLTKINNRRYLDEYLSQKWYEHMRNHLPITLMMMDVDFFKDYNDYYGHQAGDDVLKKVAATLKYSLHRSTDMLARYGGEEFCVITSDTTPDAIQHAERLREIIESLNISHDKSSFGLITVSIGINTVIPTTDMEMSDFIKNADQALYQSKEMGRNQVQVFTAE